MTTVAGTIGREKGSAASRRLRREGKIPCVVYGLDQAPESISVDYAELRDALQGKAGLNTVFSIGIDGKDTPVIIKTLQRDPVRRTVTHVDLLRVRDDVPVKVTIPIHVTGIATAVIENSGIVEQKMFQMRVQSLPDRIPDEIVVDVSRMTPETRVAVGDVELPEGVTPMMSDNITIAAPVVTRAALMAIAEDEAEEAEAEAEAAGEGASSDEDGEGGDEDSSEE